MSSFKKTVVFLVKWIEMSKGNQCVYMWQHTEWETGGRAKNSIKKVHQTSIHLRDLGIRVLYPGPGQFLKSLAKVAISILLFSSQETKSLFGCDKNNFS